MANLAIDTDILFDQASRLDATADNLASVSLPAVPELSVSTEEVAHVIEYLQSCISEHARAIRADADATRAGANDIIEAEEATAQQAQAIASAPVGFPLRVTRDIVVEPIPGVAVQVTVGG